MLGLLLAVMGIAVAEIALMQAVGGAMDRQTRQWGSASPSFDKKVYRGNKSGATSLGQQVWVKALWQSRTLLLLSRWKVDIPDPNDIFSTRDAVDFHAW